MRWITLLATALLTSTAQPFASSAEGQAIRVINPPPAIMQRRVLQPNEQFAVLAFTVETGDDDLRSDSAAWLDVTFGDGVAQKCQLKYYGSGSWNNNTTHDRDIPYCKLEQARTLDDLRKASILLVYDGVFHKAAFETPDNWNVNEVRIEAQDITGRDSSCFLDIKGNPLVRLQDASTGKTQFPANEGGSGSFYLTHPTPLHPNVCRPPTTDTSPFGHSTSP